jgi:hypothetical protein
MEGKRRPGEEDHAGKRKDGNDPGGPALRARRGGRVSTGHEGSIAGGIDADPPLAVLGAFEENPMSRPFRRILLSPLLIAWALAPEAGAQVSRETLLLRVTITDPDRQIPELLRLEADIAGSSRKEGTLDVLADSAFRDLLTARGFLVEVEKDLTPTGETIQALSDYLDPVETAARVDALAAAHPSLARKESYATTVEGRPVWALKISDNPGVDEDEPVVFFVAQHHAREVMTPEIALDIAEWLLDRYGVDAQATRWVDEREIWVLPNHNPDGTNHVFTVQSNWRKNRRPNGGGVYGVDLNRNYPYRWGACDGSSGTASSDTYRGPSAGSEPETSGGILDLARRERPLLSLSYHTYSELVLHPYGCSGVLTPENAVFREIASDMAVRSVGDGGTSWYQPGSPWELLYAVDGDSDGWFYAELGTYALTIEANASSQGFQPDYATWRDSTVERNRPAWRYVLDRPDGPSIRGRVIDACTGLPLAANVSLDEVSFVQGETPRTSDPVHGRYRWLTLPGGWTVRATLGGYREQSWPLEVGLVAADRDVRLVPTGARAIAVRTVSVDDGAGDDDGRLDPGEEARLLVRVVATGEAASGVTATLASDDPWIQVVDGAASYGSLAAGAESDGDGFTVAVSPAAPDGHVASFTISFAATETLCAPDETIPVRVTLGSPSCPYLIEPLDGNPGWTIENTGTGGWAFGPPVGNGGSTGPNAAPTGSNVYGTNLSGAYGANGDFRLTTGPFDLRGIRDADLRFWRWIDNEAGYDLASVEASVDGGQSWAPIWSGFGYGDGWQMHRIDLSSFADREEDVRFRFRLRSDGGTQGAGFYVDDVAICGEAVPNSAGKLRYESHTIADEGADFGNGNGVVDAGETVTVRVRLRSNRDTVSAGIEAFLSTTDPGVTVANDWAAFPDAPPGGISDSLAPSFTFTVDPGGCRRTIPFTLDVRWSGGSATSTFAVVVGDERRTVVLDDDFEAAGGWVPGGNATLGSFVREDPYGVTDSQGNPAQPEDDTTAAPGVACWITANPRPRGNFQPSDGDVDGGAVWIESPVFDGTDASHLDLTMQRWFTRRTPGQLDQSRFRLRVSSDGGSAWSDVEVLTADASQWTPVAFDLARSVAPSSQMRLRVEVEENVSLGDTLLEGLVDDVRVERIRLECDPFAPPARLAPNPVGVSLRVDKRGPHVSLGWEAPSADTGHDPATGYRVYRSSRPADGYALESTPTDAFRVRADALGDGLDDYYVVVAENRGGTSGDEPSP